MKVITAPTNRASCQLCKKPIKTGEKVIEYPNDFRGQISYRKVCNRCSIRKLNEMIDKLYENKDKL